MAEMTLEELQAREREIQLHGGRDKSLQLPDGRTIADAQREQRERERIELAEQRERELEALTTAVAGQERVSLITTPEGATFAAPQLTTTQNVFSQPDQSGEQSFLVSGATTDAVIMPEARARQLLALHDPNSSGTVSVDPTSGFASTIEEFAASRETPFGEQVLDDASELAPVAQTAAREPSDTVTVIAPHEVNVAVVEQQEQTSRAENE